MPKAESDKEALRELFPELSEEELEEAEENFDEYVALSLRMFQRLYPELNEEREVE